MSAPSLKPRFKSQHIQDDEQLARVKDILYADARDCRDTQQHRQESSASSSNPPGPPPPKKRNLDSMFKEQETEDDSDEMPVLSPEQQFSAELTLYENASVGVSTLCSECAFDPDRVRIDCVHT